MPDGDNPFAKYAGAGGSSTAAVNPFAKYNASSAGGSSAFPSAKAPDTLQSSAPSPGAPAGEAAIAGAPAGNAGMTYQTPEGPTAEQATKTLLDLEAQGVPKTDPRYQQAIKDRALGFERLTSGALGYASGAGKTGALAAGAVEKAWPEALGIAKRLMPGATKEAQAAVSKIGQASDDSLLGEKMHGALTKRMNDLRKTRSEAAESAKSEYFSQPIEMQRKVAGQYQEYLGDLLLREERDLGPDRTKILYDSAQRLSSDPSIEAMDIERRRLNELASGKIEGASATDQLFAGRLANGLERILRKEIPAAGKFIDQYKEMSEPLDVFQTTLGTKAVKQAGEYLPDKPYYDPAILPKSFFQSRFSIKNLRDLSGGDSKFVDDAASEYAATQLKDLSSKDARAWVDKANKAGWLDEVPAVKKEVEDYVSNLEKVTHTQDKAKRAAYGAAIAGGGEYVFHRLKSLVGM